MWSPRNPARRKPTGISAPPATQLIELTREMAWGGMNAARDVCHQTPNSVNSEPPIAISGMTTHVVIPRENRAMAAIQTKGIIIALCIGC